MKKVLLTLAMLLTLGMSLEAAAQKHRHTPQQTELTDSTSKDAIEAFSDTTSTSLPTTTAADDDWQDDDDWDAGFSKLFDMGPIKSKEMAGMIFVLCVLLIIFVLAPVLIIIALFYFINKNRKEKMRLAQMAVQQGQPIPNQLLEEKTGSTDEEYQKGMRQCFVGVGLMIFLGYAAGEVGFGVGALVFCIGLGKVFASRSALKKQEKNNDFIQNNYD